MASAAPFQLQFHRNFSSLTSISSLKFPKQERCYTCRVHLSKVQCLSPPKSREESISQAKRALSSTLKKPLNNPIPLPTRKLKKITQPRFRVEIPIIDDSSNSLIKLAFDLFSNLRISKKGKEPIFLLIWPSSTLSKLAQETFLNTDSIANSHFSSISIEKLNSCDVVVFVAPESSQLGNVKGVSDDFYPKPVVLFNPNWSYDEENDLELKSFVGSFNVVYSFMGLEVRGVIKKRKGVVFKCVEDGIVSNEEWVIMVEDEEGEDKEKLKVVSKFKRRPNIVEVESVLYNLMAVNSPITKSVKFLKDLASNVMGKKAN